MAERAVYCGNYEYEMPEREIRRLFEEYGRVNRIDMKTGFCFVYMDDDKDGDYAIRKLDGMTVGYKRRPLKVQWAKTKDADRKKDVQPTPTLFIVNFDLARTRERDIERHFEAYGRIKRVEIKKSYAFVEFENVDDAIYAMRKASGSMLEGRTITVEYAQNNDPDAARQRGFPGDGDRDRGYEDRERDRGYDRERGYDRRERSPPRRERSPDDRGRSRSPPPARRNSRDLSR